MRVLESRRRVTGPCQWGCFFPRGQVIKWQATLVGRRLAHESAAAMGSKKNPVRAPHETLYARLSPEDAARARNRAEHFGMTIADYLTALVRGDTPFPIPASHVRLGGCVVDAIGVLSRPEPDAAAAIRLLREAQRLGAEFERAYLPAFDASHADDEPEQSTDAQF